MAEEGGNWRDSLPDELKDAPALKDIPDIETLAKNHIDLQAHIGNMRRVPKPDEAEGDIQAYLDKILTQDDVTKDLLMLKPDLSKEDQADEFFQSLGKPKEPEGYTMPEFSEDVKLNNEVISGIKQRAHKYNLTDAQFRKYIEDTINEQLQTQATHHQQWEDGLKELRQEWGLAFDQNVNDAVNLAIQTGSPQAEQLKAGYGDKDTLKWFYEQSRRLGTEGNHISQQDGGARIETPNELRARRATLFNRLDELTAGGAGPNDPQRRQIQGEIMTIAEKLEQSQTTQ